MKVALYIILQSPQRAVDNIDNLLSLFLSAVVFHIKLLSIEEMLIINTERFLKEMHCFNAVRTTNSSPSHFKLRASLSHK